MKPHRLQVGENLMGFPAHSWNWILDSITELQNHVIREQSSPPPSNFDNRAIVVNCTIDYEDIEKPLGIGSIVGLRDGWGATKKAGKSPQRWSAGHIMLKGERPERTSFDPGNFLVFAQGQGPATGGGSMPAFRGNDPEGEKKTQVIGVINSIDPESRAIAQNAGGSVNLIKTHVGDKVFPGVVLATAVICGPMHVWLDVLDSAHEFATVAPRTKAKDEHGVLREDPLGSFRHMQTHATGESGVRVLWKELDHAGNNEGARRGLQKGIILMQMAPSRLIDRSNLVLLRNGVKGWDGSKIHGTSCVPTYFRDRPVDYYDLTDEERITYDENLKAEQLAFGSSSMKFLEIGLTSDEGAGMFYNASPHYVEAGPVIAMRVDGGGETDSAEYVGVPLNLEAAQSFNPGANQSLGHNLLSSAYTRPHSELGEAGGSGPMWQNDGTC